MRDYIAVLGAMALGCAATSCGTSPERAAASRADDLTGATAVAPAGIVFTKDWTQSVTGTLVGGGQAAIAYDAARLGGCREEQGGRPMWAVTGYASVNGLPATSFPVA